MGLSSSKTESSPVDDNIDDVDVIDITEIEEANTDILSRQKVAENVVNDIVKNVINKLEENHLYQFKKWVVLDSKNVDEKDKCLRLIEQDLVGTMNSDKFTSNYTYYYEYLGTLGKTAFDVCKCKYTLDKYNSLIST